MLAKVEKSHANYLKNRKKIAETEKRIGLLGSRATELRERFDHLRATSNRSGGREWKDLQTDVNALFSSYTVARTSI